MCARRHTHTRLARSLVPRPLPPGKGLASRSHAFSIRAREKGCLRATCSLLQEFLQDQSDCRIVPLHVYPPTQYAGRCGFSKISSSLSLSCRTAEHRQALDLRQVYIWQATAVSIALDVGRIWWVKSRTREDTLQGKKVKDSWKELLTSTGTVSVVAEIDLDQLIGTEENPQFMCRSCFEKYKTLRSELVEKAERALAKMNAVPNTSRRKRNCTALEQPTSKRLFVEDEQTSPAVVVSATL